MVREQRKKRLDASRLSLVFGADVRSLALMRIGLGLVVMYDVICRAADLAAHYTDGGVLRRADLLENFAWLHAWPLCVHLVSGGRWPEAAVFLLHLVLALALVVGYRTRLTTPLVWLFTASVQLRNLYIGEGADAELRLLLFWGCFLPLGATYSVDRALAGPTAAPPRQQLLSVGTVAIFAQLIILYLSTGYAKSLQPEWRSGWAVAASLNDEMWSTRIGLVLLQMPLLCRALTYGVLGVELLAPLLLLVPVYVGPLRTAVVAALVCMHFGFALGLRVGIFPYTSAACVLFFLPAWFWDRLELRLGTPQRRGVQLAAAPGRCARAARIATTFFLPPETGGVSGAAIGLRPGDCWLLVDHTGARHRDHGAVIALCAASPVLWPLVPLLRHPTAQRWGGILCARWARSAGADRPDPVAAAWPSWSRAAAVTCGALLAYVVVWNIGVVRDPAYTAPPAIAWLGSSLFLQQDWRMFAHTTRTTGWVSVPGRLRDGRALELFAAGGPIPDHIEPVQATRAGPVLYQVTDDRWILFVDRLVHGKRGGNQLLFYGRYLCRAWNASHSGSEQLETLDIHFMSRHVEPELHSYPAETYRDELLWTHGCFR